MRVYSLACPNLCQGDVPVFQLVYSVGPSVGYFQNSGDSRGLVPHEDKLCLMKLRDADLSLSCPVSSPLLQNNLEGISCKGVHCLIDMRISNAGQVGQRVKIRVHVKMDGLPSHSYVRNDLSV